MTILRVIQRECGYRGMPDDQAANERAAKEKLESALQEMWRAIHAVNVGSAVVSINTDAFSEFIHDHLPDSKTWERKIVEARQR